jgi:carboxymethylenebutenolidase
MTTVSNMPVTANSVGASRSSGVCTTKVRGGSRKKYEPVTYEGAGHGFMRAGEDPANTNQDNVKAHDQAWERWKALLKKL